MICYIEGGERQSEEVCTAGSLWFTSRVSVAFCLFLFVSLINKCLENIKQTSKWLFKVLLFHLSYIYFETKVEIEKLFFAISYEVITIFSFL